MDPVDPPRFEDTHPEAAAILADLAQGRLIPPRPVFWTVLGDGMVVEYRDRHRREIIAWTKAPAIGRNDPCPCGSGKKFKKCCG